MTARDDTPDFKKRAACAGLISEIERLERVAHDKGCTVTARALNNAKNACGWEAAGNIELAGKAARGERAGG